MEWCECGAGEGIVDKEVREGRDDRGVLRGAVGAGELHVEVVNKGVGRAVVKGSGEVGRGRAGGWSERGIGG